MPTYRNTSTTGIVFEGKMFLPNSNVITSRYVDADNLTLVSHTPRVSPFSVLHAGVLPMAAAHDLPKYEQISIYNSTGDAVTIVANEDATKSFDIPNGDRWILDLNYRWESIEATGTGGGNLHVLGFYYKFTD